ncbi:cytochrome P450 [Streptomyces sp. NPDC101175]|uniref:cytochrome P450 n=1 Tax=Streptomyces sp. NPDC101175 TaxID=3366123 RepID=UPI00383686A1
MTGAPSPTVPHYDPTDPAVQADPYPLYRTLRETDPVHWNPPGFWFLTRHADVHTLLRDPRLGADNGGGNGGGDGGANRGGTASDGGGEAHTERMAGGDTPSMILMDPPGHTRLRALVNKVFTPRSIAYLHERIERITDRLLDDWGTGEGDFVADFAYPLPLAVICEMLGVPEADRDDVRDWSEDMAHLVDPVVTPETVARGLRGRRRIVAYFRDLVAERRRAPGEDILSGLIRAETEGDRLSSDELLSTAALLVVAGHETTANMIANGMLALLRHPDQLELLRSSGPDLVPPAVEEMLRYDGPAQAVGRRALTDLDLHGVRVPRGARLVLSLGAANRDPERFPDPDRFDIARRDNRHLALSGGAHFCVGAPLARMEATVAFTALLRRHPHLRLAAEPRWRERTGLRGLRELRVRL